ncbi:MAG: hypothetical protein KME25_08635 [Symplocastrum torsivum CPER-KK1]|jgi:hypothetical protein|uniref:DUF1574 domain-containing protein n=1 Tax=Symplocastrum torsivum CPER-KK1 TaxID=450513 RepID=A0A951PIK0_9CYAN|nr:hypothetical protein [Symplocastrum torsivum CPER-KK1]
MPKFCLRLHSAATAALLTFVAGCSWTLPPRTTANRTFPFAATSGTRAVSSSQAPSSCPQVDPFSKGIGKAQDAAILAQSAQSKQDWDLVVTGWIQAIEGMQSVPQESPKRAFAQKKVAEYLKNLDVALQKSATSNSQLPFTSFGNPIFDEQLLLYLSYVAAVGPPDVLIVGSSRALIGVDPRQLQQKLAAQGKGNLKIFNFGVNGATAQMVDLQLRQILTREQLPRLIVWADGIRAFNSGRVDRTYNSMVASEGYQSLIAGDRPILPSSPPDTADACEDIPDAAISQKTKQKSNSSDSTHPTVAVMRWRLARVSFETTSNPTPSPINRLLLTQLSQGQMPSRLTLVRNTTGGYNSFAIDANGFLPLDSRFDPKTYYQKNPRVAGRYDADYQPFSLAGQQATALNSVKAFARQQQIPLVFVNLPITQDYLDPVRRTREQQFQQMMQQQAGGGFTFIDLGKQWLTQNEYFTDPSHLNRYGAAAIASQLATNTQIPWPQPRSE